MDRQAKRTRQDTTPAGRAPAWHGAVYVGAAVAVASALLIYFASPLAFYAGMIEGLMALGIIGAASAAGLWLVWATGNGDLPVRWQIGLGAGFGLGGLSLGMLMAGLRGQLSQRFWFVVMGVLAAAGVAAIYRLGRILERQSRIASAQDDAEDPAVRRWRWLWLLIVPAIALGVLAATVPPGLLWIEEGNGYDVLEYHLGVPKEYFFLGRIEYLDHNMYSNFPMNAEMLYLLPMVLQGSPFKAAITAQMIHLLLGGLAGYAAWLIGRDYSRKVGIVAGVAGVGFAWSIYLGALAYVENGMLFYGLLAAGLCGRAIRDAGEQTWSRALAVGAMVGLACGYKYTAIPMIAVPLLGLWAVLNLVNRPVKLSNALIPLLMAGAFFAPWMSKNQRMTNDPFFPLGHGVFGSRVWTDAEYAKFQAGHAPLPAEQSIGARFEQLWQRVIAEPRWGYVPWIVAAAGAALALSLGATGGLPASPAVSKTVPKSVAPSAGFRREVAIWLAILGVQIVVWLAATHLFARFASVMWIPLVFLVSTVAAWALGKKGPAGFLACLVGLVIYLGVGYAWVFDQYRSHLYVQGEQLPVHGNNEVFFFGGVPGFGHLEFINGDGQNNPGLPYNARLLMVADARIFYVNRPCDYSVVFSRDRFAQAIEQAGGSADGVLAWLAEQGYTHVWVSFAEIDRLSSTYGLPAQITPSLFPRLEKTGLKRLQEIRISGLNYPYGILYEVPKP